MLNKSDKEYIHDTVNTAISNSEAKLEAKLYGAIGATESRLYKAIDSLEVRVFGAIKDLQTDMNEKFVQLLPMREEMRIFILELTGVKSRTGKLEKRTDRLEQKVLGS
jgi:hypothetical protein